MFHFQNYWTDFDEATYLVVYGKHAQIYVQVTNWIVFLGFSFIHSRDGDERSL